MSESLLAGANAVADQLAAFLTAHGFFGTVVADHICYICGTHEEYEQLLEMLTTENSVVYQVPRTDNPTVYLFLDVPIETTFGLIRYLELRDGSNAVHRDSRFDHITVVPKYMTFDALVEFAKEQVLVTENRRPTHTAYDIPFGTGHVLRLSPTPFVERLKRRGG